MPKIVIVRCDFDYDKEDFLIDASTPWEEVTEEELKILQQYVEWGHKIIVHVPVVEKLKTVSQHLAKAKKNKEDIERRAKERKLKEKERNEEKKRKEIEKAKQLLAKEGLIPALDSLGKDH